ncbi:MAG: SRPBCC family protein [Actinomycetota bacterium]|nr:SRPBCC family protein [Actinomycetota bacterium]
MANTTAKLLAAGAVLYAARRYFRDWGTTKDESSRELPGDDLIAPPVLRATEGVWIDAGAAAVWSWLVQMGQDRGGLYSFEKLENALGLHYRNADRIHPEWQHLGAGDTVRLVPRGWLGLADGVELTVVRIVDGESIVLRGRQPALPWDLVWSFHVYPHWDDRCRLLIRSRLALRRPVDSIAAELIGPARALVTRGILLGIKRRAQARPEAEKPAASPASGATAAGAGFHRVV